MKLRSAAALSRAEGVGGQDDGAVGGIALVRQKKDLRLEIGRLFDRIGIAGQKALLHRPGIGDEGGGVVGIGPQLGVGEAIGRLQPDPEGLDPRLGHQEGAFGQVGDGVKRGVGMGHQDLRILLEEGGDGPDRRAGRDQVHGGEAVGRHAQLHRARGQKLGHIRRRTALDDLDVQAPLLIGAGRQGLIEAAVIGLGPPVQGETQPHPALFVHRRLGPAAGAQSHPRSPHGRSPRDQGAATGQEPIPR